MTAPRLHLPATDRLLKADEAAKVLRTGVSRFRDLAETSAALRSGKVWRGRLCFWLESAVVKHMHLEMERKVAPRRRSA